MKIRRSNDTLCLIENWHENIKEIFKFIIRQSFSKKDFYSNISIITNGLSIYRQQYSLIINL